jgi:anaerobic selenocysteine-containing dehydrogenase
VIGKAGIGTPHMDGNTRLCTATAAAAFQESFGCDGQPGSYTDIDHCDALFLFGHNVAETQTVLWARMLDRLDGPNPPRPVCVDPRGTTRSPSEPPYGLLHRGTVSFAAASSPW